MRIVAGLVLLGAETLFWGPGLLVWLAGITSRTLIWAWSLSPFPVTLLYVAAAVTVAALFWRDYSGDVTWRPVQRPRVEPVLDPDPDGGERAWRGYVAALSADGPRPGDATLAEVIPLRRAS